MQVGSGKVKYMDTTISIVLAACRCQQNIVQKHTRRPVGVDQRDDTVIFQLAPFENGAALLIFASTLSGDFGIQPMWAQVMNRRAARPGISRVKSGSQPDMRQQCNCYSAEQCGNQQRSQIRKAVNHQYS